MFNLDRITGRNRRVATIPLSLVLCNESRSVSFSFDKELLGPWPVIDTEFMANASHSSG